MEKETKKFGLIITAAVLAVLLVFGGLLSAKPIPSGMTGVVSTFGKVQDNYLASGLHFVNPIGTKVIKMNNKIQRADVDMVGASKDLQTVNGSISVNYYLTPDSSVNIFKNVGRDYETVIIRPAIQETSKAVISKYTAEELITKRDEVSSNMKEALTQKIEDYGLIVNEYNILNFDFSAEFNAAIEAKQTAQQQALKAEQDLARIKVEAEQKVAQAQAEAEAYKLKSQEITEQMIMMEFVQKWNGQMPEVMLSNDVNSLLDISAIKKQVENK